MPDVYKQLLSQSRTLDVHTQDYNGDIATVPLVTQGSLWPSRGLRSGAQAHRMKPSKTYSGKNPDVGDTISAWKTKLWIRSDSLQVPDTVGELTDHVR